MRVKDFLIGFANDDEVEFGDQVQPRVKFPQKSIASQKDYCYSLYWIADVFAVTMFLENKYVRGSCSKTQALFSRLQDRMQQWVEQEMLGQEAPLQWVTADSTDSFNDKHVVFICPLFDENEAILTILRLGFNVVVLEEEAPGSTA